MRSASVGGKGPASRFIHAEKVEKALKDVPLGAALSGSLPCVTCHYELKGLSIAGACPECGTAIRATILFTIDPEAEEFQPLPTPKLTSICLVGWAGGALLAALAAWSVRMGDVVGLLRGSIGAKGYIGWACPGIFVGALISAFSMTGLIRPSRTMPLWKSAAALFAVAAYVPLLWAVLRMQSIDTGGAPPYFASSLNPERIEARLVAMASFMAILLGSRPNARELVKRSLALRIGRVDRQTILAMVTAAGVVCAGDALRWWGHSSDQPHAVAVGTLIVAVGSLFITLGLVSATVDGWRIAKAIRMPPPTVRDLVGAKG